MSVCVAFATLVTIIPNAEASTWRAVNCTVLVVVFVVFVAAQRQRNKSQHKEHKIVDDRMLLILKIFAIAIQIIAIDISTSNQKFASCAQLNPQQHQQHQAAQESNSFSQSVPNPLITSDKTADLGPLINETLTINNKSLSALDADRQVIKDDWTFDLVEYDLIDFLQDLSARYKLNNRSQPIDDESQLDARNELKEKSQYSSLLTTALNRELTVDYQSTNPSKISHPTAIPDLSTSLASEDHDISESTWQYGIFDRFTRSRSGSTSTAIPQDPYVDSIDKFDPANFNDEECGLRVYDDQAALDAPLTEPTLLSVRRQRPSILGAIAHKHFTSPRPSMSDRDDNGSDKGVSDWLNQSEKDAYESYTKNQPSDLGAGNEGSDVYDPLSSDNGNFSGEFNLSSRRHWMQQQLGNTLQMFKFNVTGQMAGEFLNQTASLNLNTREKVKKLSKASKSQDYVDNLSYLTHDQNLSARQDDLKLEARVIGGTDARLGDSPWSVSLQALVSRPSAAGGVEYRHYCGGTIVSQHYILTAAHCLDFMVGREARLFVVIGDLNWRMNAASLHGRRFGIEKLIIHSGYKSTAFGHDIGLIKTKESMKPVKVNGRYIINSVCLPAKGVEHSGEAELVGWGLFSNRNEMADSLQIADVPILPRPLCVDLYRRRTGLIQWLIGIELITEKQVCAGTFGRGICQGDSGSALVVNEKVSKRNDRQLNKLMRNGPSSRNHPTKATIIGIVAFGGIRRCSYQSLPGVYMQTSKYMDWILPRIQK